jgi:hypothetical protein
MKIEEANQGRRLREAWRADLAMPMLASHFASYDSFPEEMVSG